MTTNKNLFLFLLFVGLLSSCSIEKRVHSNGYHIDWNGKPSRLELKEITLTKKHKSFNSFTLSKQDYKEKIIDINTSKAGLFKRPETDSDTTKKKTTINKVASFFKTFAARHFATSNNNTNQEDNDLIRPNEIEQELETQADSDVKYDAFAIVSAVTLITGGLISIRFLFLLFLGSANVGLLSLGAGLLVLSLIISIMSIIRTAENPELKGRELAWTALVLSIIGAALSLFLLLIIPSSSGSVGG
jgi:hypothetical protein